MQKSGLMAIALAGVLLVAVVPYGATVWADSDKARDKAAVKETKQARFDDDDEEKGIQNASLGSVKAGAKAIAVVKKAGSLTTFSASTKDAYGNAITNATYAWALGNQSLGTLALSSNTASATFTASAVSAVTSSALTVTATHGGASASSAATVTVSPA